MTTVRTIKLKRNPQASPESAPATLPTADAAQAPQDSTPPTQATMAPQQPVAAVPAQPVKGTSASAKSYMPYTIFASVVVLFFLIIMGLQYSEMSHYSADPSVWIGK